MNTDRNKQLEDAILAQFERFLEQEEQYLDQEQYGTEEQQVELQLKWFTAYVILKAVCAEIIAPYCSDTDATIDHFWHSYRAKDRETEHVPGIEAFFDWYCYDDEAFAFMK